ncbi:hypothetical protein [Acinetobacter pseudolwoffii]|uniref:Uncharacterized protein n=1 Tax=Acinetobacter pseudolwoffii TaxID=2053287 RepID=A0A2H9YRP6_9GAMM|nr:hypothetical protein [Acinetobacter pseudolwoffii]PJO75317.1 hypothetical protein CWI32_07225 [Acinetobacter pseudolwoffii]
MKKLLLSVLVLTASFTLANANTETKKSANLGNFQGRYALDCSVQKAHNLSYVIGDKSILRLISAKKKSGVFEKKFVRQGRKASDGSQYQFTVAYTGFDVDFYKKGEQNWINVHSTGIVNHFGPKTKEALVQCKSET